MVVTVGGGEHSEAYCLYEMVGLITCFVSDTCSLQLTTVDGRNPAPPGMPKAL